MRYFILTACLIAPLCLGSCAEAPRDDAPSIPVSDVTATAQQDARRDALPLPLQAVTMANPSSLSERLKGLDPRDISQSEMTELMALETQQQEHTQAFQNKQRAWSRQDPASRGPQPVYAEFSQTDRLQALLGKLQIAEIRKTHGNIDREILSKADAEEYIALQQASTRRFLEHQKRFSAWSKQDPLSRGPQPQMNPATPSGWRESRRQELQVKVQTAHGVQQEINRLKALSAAHNIPILDNEMSELIVLHAENQKLQADMQTAIVNVLIDPNGQVNTEALAGGQLSDDVIDRLPQDLLLRMSNVSERLDAIQAPFDAAEKADDIRKDMAVLSEISGVPISSGDIEKTVALSAEKDRIMKRVEREVTRKWKAEGGAVSAFKPLIPNAEDAERLEVIEAKLNEISAPLVTAK